MPRDLLEEKITVEKAPAKKKTGFKAVGEDVWTGAKAAFPATLQMVKEIPGQLADIAGVTDQGEYSTQRARRIIKSNASKGARGLANAPANVIDYLREKELIPDWMRAARPDTANKIDYDKKYGLEGERPGDALLGIGAQMAANPFGKLTPAAWAIGQNENPITAQLMPQILKGVPKGILGTVEAVRNTPITPSGAFAKYADSVGTPAEIAKNAQAAQGTQSLLGDVIKSPSIKNTFENVTSEVPFAGGKKILGNVAKELDKKADAVLNDLKGNKAISGDENIFVQRLVNNAFDMARKEKNNLYRDVDKISQDSNFDLRTPKLVDELFQNADAIRQSPILLSDAKFRRGFNSLFDKMANDEPLNLAEVKTMLNDFNMYGSKLEKSISSADKFYGQMFKDVSRVGRDEIRTRIQDSKIPGLKDAYEKADRNYAENYAPFLEKDIHKFFQEDTNAHTIVRDIINPSKKIDNPATIERIQNIMPKGNENLLGYTYLRNAFDKEGVLNLNELTTLVNALGKRQFESLFPKVENRQQILDFVRLSKMNAEARNLFFNPKTGGRTPSTMVKGGVFGAGLALVLAGQPLKAMAVVGVPIAAAKYFNSKVSSSKFRDAVVKKIIKQQGKNPLSLPEIPDELYRIIGLSGLANQPTDEEKSK